MTSDPLDLPATTQHMRTAARAAQLDARATARAMDIAAATPGPREWRDFLSRALALLGTALLLAGAVCFIAYNWDRFGRFSKFALVEGAIVAATLLAWRRLPRIVGQVALFAAAVLVGPLLAIYGQTYQTGADPYGLFLTWSWLILPWTVAARFGALWLLDIAVFDVALSLYWFQVVGTNSFETMLYLPLAIAALHLGAVVVFEWQLRRPHHWLEERWAARVLAATGFVALGIVACAWVLADKETGTSGVLGLLALAIGIAAALQFYRRYYPDRFLVTAAISVGMITVAVAVGRVLFDFLKLDVLGFFLMAGFVILEITLGVSWFRGSRTSPATES